ncbi:hypothetical protein AB205_0177030 [Aquarana catesbeiana]|uniref:Uncharacterized protein n=1 Tax=Aquarana catesbeiana TaxID=8400 RepID=A0A2G9Q7T5_AQUCT|nr:hypothetical protein AB205_0177030 [Aquarana catesbeiana]
MSSSPLVYFAIPRFWMQQEQTTSTGGETYLFLALSAMQTDATATSKMSAVWKFFKTD